MTVMKHLTLKTLGTVLHKPVYCTAMLERDKIIDSQMKKGDNTLIQCQPCEVDAK